MKLIISVLIIIGVYMGIRSVFREYKKEEARQNKQDAPQPAAPADALTGMPANFDPSLQAAQAQGAPALKAWLDRYRPYLHDPKLGAIELDYALLISRTDPAEAKRVFAQVKQRTPANSPLNDRVKRLDSTFGP
jgi:hypothetical protein